jgi:hypothetical protein
MHLQKIAAAIGMTVGADIAEADPAVVRTRRMRTEVVGSFVDLVATASGEPHMGWRRTGRQRVRQASLFTRQARGLARETCKRLRFALASG